MRRVCCDSLYYLLVLSFLVPSITEISQYRSNPKFVPNIFEPQREQTNTVDSDQVWHKPGCTATGDG